MSAHQHLETWAIILTNAYNLTLRNFETKSFIFQRQLHKIIFYFLLAPSLLKVFY